MAQLLPRPTSTAADVGLSEAADGLRATARLLQELGLSFGNDPAYDVRQPLAAIATLADTALSDSAPPGVRREAVRRISDVARSLLDLCRAVRSSGRPRQLSLAAAAAPVVAERAAATGCSIDLDVRRIAIAADETALQLALWSLLDTACAAAGRNGKVRVTARRDGQYAAIEITDSGPRVGAGPPPPASVGLDVVGPLARREGWQLQVDPDVVGGATTVLLVPCEPGGGPVAGVVVCGETRLGGDAIAAALERRDIDVLAVVRDLPRCIEALHSHQPALCIVSDALSETDTRVLLAQVKQASAGTRVVLLSAEPAAIVADVARNDAVTAVVSLDGGLEQVAAAIEQCIHDDGPARPPLGAGTPERLTEVGLTPRELEVLELLVNGTDTAALAAELGITYTTARAHIQKVLMKLGVHSKLEAVSYALKSGIVLPPDR